MRVRFQIVVPKRTLGLGSRPVECPGATALPVRQIYHPQIRDQQGQGPSRIFKLSNRKSRKIGSLESLTGFEGVEQINKPVRCLVDLGRDTRTSTQSRRIVRRKDASWSLEPELAFWSKFASAKAAHALFLVPL